jgi:hypothetical protein
MRGREREPQERADQPVEAEDHQGDSADQA